MNKRKFFVGLFSGIIASIACLYIVLYASATITRVGIENGKVLTDTPTADSDAVNKLYLDQNYFAKIAVSGTIDAKTVATTDLYTVPTGYKFYLKQVDIETISVVGASGTFSFTIGANNPGYDNWLASGVFGSIAQDIFKTFHAGLPMPGSVIYAAGDVVKLNIVGGATATTFTIKAKCWGYLEAI